MELIDGNGWFLMNPWANITNIDNLDGY